MTMILVSTVTVGAGGAASIDFNSIPGTYTDLMLVLSGRGSSSSAYVTMALNGSASSFTVRRLIGFSGSTGSDSYSLNIIGDATGTDLTANAFASNQVYIPNYAGSTNKSFSTESVQENNGTASNHYLIAGSWANTAAITSISLGLSGGSWVQYSTATLYGILKGSGGATVS